MTRESLLSHLDTVKVRPPLVHRHIFLPSPAEERRSLVQALTVHRISLLCCFLTHGRGA